MSAPILAFAEEALGFTLYPRQAAILEEIYSEGIRTGILRLGRRSGKGRIAAVVGTYEATVNAPAHMAAVPAGEQVAIVIVAKAQKQARVIHRFVRDFLKRPGLDHLVKRDTDDEIELTNGIVILTVPCHAASVRGLAVAVVIMDEAAWFQGRDGSPLDPKEIWDALVPATAQFAERRVLVLSTPRWAIGWFADQVALAASGRFDDVRTWHAATAEMNPAISRSFLEQERAKDPAAFRREYEAEFTAEISAVFDADLVRAAVRSRGALAAQAGRRYVVAVDAAYTGDTFAAMVGHLETTGSVIVDRVDGWRGSRAKPLEHGATLDAIAALSTGYGRADVVIDQYAAEPIRQGLAERGVNVLARPWSNASKVDAVAAVRQVLYAGHLELPDHKSLIEELVTLEQRPTPSGAPRIAAPGRLHDDWATSLMALVLELVVPAGGGFAEYYRQELERLRAEQGAAA